MGQETHFFYGTCRYLQPLELSCAELQTNEPRTHQNAKCIERKKKSNSRKLAAVSRPISQCIRLIWFCSKTCEINHAMKPCGSMYESLILGQLLDLISPSKINISEPRFKSYDPWDMATSTASNINPKMKDGTFFKKQFQSLILLKIYLELAISHVSRVIGFKSGLKKIDFTQRY